MFWIFLRLIKFLRVFLGSSRRSVCFWILTSFPDWFRLCLVVLYMDNVEVNLFERDGTCFYDVFV